MALNDPKIMSGNNLLNIVHCSVGNLDIVPIECLMQNMSFGEAFTENSQKLCTNVGFHIRGPRWIEPDDLSVPVSSVPIVGSDVGLKLQLMVISTCC